MLWTSRLGTFLLARILGESGKDSRFDQARNNFPRFLMLWTLQATWVYFVLYSALLVNYATKNNNLSAANYIGWAIFWIGWLTEIISDRQKSKFKNNESNRGNFITTGLWKYSRHPNYFGEILLWIGIYIAVIPAMHRWGYISIISPIWTIILLVFLSGVPIAEKHTDARFGTRQDYIEYKKNTPVLIPFCYCWR